MHICKIWKKFLSLLYQVLVEVINGAIGSFCKTLQECLFFVYCHGAKFVINSSFAKLLGGRRISEKVCKVGIYCTYEKSLF